MVWWELSAVSLTWQMLSKSYTSVNRSNNTHKSKLLHIHSSEPISFESAIAILINILLTASVLRYLERAYNIAKRRCQNIHSSMTTDSNHWWLYNIIVICEWLFVITWHLLVIMCRVMRQKHHLGLHMIRLDNATAAELRQGKYT